MKSSQERQGLMSSRRPHQAQEQKRSDAARAKESEDDDQSHSSSSVGSNVEKGEEESEYITGLVFDDYFEGETQSQLDEL